MRSAYKDLTLNLPFSNVARPPDFSKQCAAKQWAAAAVSAWSCSEQEHRCAGLCCCDAQQNGSACTVVSPVRPGFWPVGSSSSISGAAVSRNRAWQVRCRPVLLRCTANVCSCSVASSVRPQACSCLVASSVRSQACSARSQSRSVQPFGIQQLGIMQHSQHSLWEHTL